MKKIVTALIGYGLSGREFHLPQLLSNKHYKLKTVMTTDPKKQADLKSIQPNLQIATNYEDILNDTDIELVILAVSNDVHFDYTKQALLKKKHVICEKPFVKTLEEATYLFELAKKQGCLLRVFHNRKYDGDILTVEKLMTEKAFGKIVSFHARFDRFVPNIKQNWRYKQGHMSGIFYDLAPHLIHHAVRLFGKPVSVSNQLFMDRPLSETDDHFELMLFYPSMTCFIGAEPYERSPIPKLKLVGTEASYVKFGFDQPEVITTPQTMPFTDLPHHSHYIKAPGESELIPVLRGTHYLFYDTYYEDLMNENLKDEDEILALVVIEIMEKAMISAVEKRIIKL